MTTDIRVFPWKKELETGIDTIDKQHMEFLKHANKFMILLSSGKAEEGIKEEYEFLKEYLKTHFETEEAVMLESGYPHLADHAGEHSKLTAQTAKLDHMVRTAEEETMIANVFASFVKDWFISHIMISDKLFSDYYNEKNG